MWRADTLNSTPVCYWTTSTACLLQCVPKTGVGLSEWTQGQRTHYFKLCGQLLCSLEAAVLQKSRSANQGPWKSEIRGWMHSDHYVNKHALSFPPLFSAVFTNTNAFIEATSINKRASSTCNQCYPLSIAIWKIQTFLWEKFYLFVQQAGTCKYSMKYSNDHVIPPTVT